MSDQAFFPLAVSGEASVAGNTIILSGTNNLASNANFIRIDANQTVQNSDVMIVLNGWVNGSHPYSNIAATGPYPGVIGQCPLEIEIPGNFSVSSITAHKLGSATSYYFTYGCLRDVNQIASNITARDQNL
jgi:hypothetical protein